MDLTFSSLKQRHRAVRDGLPPAHALRTHRALSWLDRAEREKKDDDARFIFLWIALNAAYAVTIDERWRFSERRLLLQFLQRLIATDRGRLLYGVVWEKFPGPIRLLIDNKYVHQPFWEWRKGLLTETEWLGQFERGKHAAFTALARQDTRKVLAVVFERLYVLRNQLIHGGATWNGRVNREQVRDGANIMGRLVPIILLLMLENPDQS